MARRDVPPDIFITHVAQSSTWTANQKFNDDVQLIFGTGCDANLQFDTTGAVCFFRITGATNILLCNACNNNVAFPLELERLTSGTPTDLLGTGLRIWGESSTTRRVIGDILWQMTTVANATLTSDVIFNHARCGTFTVGMYLDGSTDNLNLSGPTYLKLGNFTDANRGAATCPGRLIWNTTDTAVNVADGTNWRLITGCVT